MRILTFVVCVLYTCVPCYGADNNVEVSNLLSGISKFLEQDFKRAREEVTLYASNLPNELIDIICDHWMLISASIILKDTSKKTISAALKKCARENKLDLIKILINCNSCITQGQVCPNPISSIGRDSTIICKFFDFVTNNKNRIENSDAINKIVSARYPFAPYEAWYGRRSFAHSDWGSEPITHFLNAGFIIPIHPDIIGGAQPMLFYFATGVTSYNADTKKWVDCPPRYATFTYLLDNGANPNYKHETRDYKWAGNYTQKWCDLFEYIDSCAVCTVEDKQELKNIALRYVRYPVNTTDPFYVGTRGYRADLISGLKPWQH